MSSNMEKFNETQRAYFNGWWLTDQRKEFLVRINSVPRWLKPLIMMLRPIRWARAVSASKTAMAALRTHGDCSLFNACCYMADCRWAELFNLDPPEVK